MDPMVHAGLTKSQDVPRLVSTFWYQVFLKSVLRQFSMTSNVTLGAKLIKATDNSICLQPHRVKQLIRGWFTGSLTQSEVKSPSHANNLKAYQPWKWEKRSPITNLHGPACCSRTYRHRQYPQRGLYRPPPIPLLTTCFAMTNFTTCCWWSQWETLNLESVESWLNQWMISF